MNYDIDCYKDEIHCLYAEKKELQARIDNAICILNELYDCDMKEEDYSLIHFAIKTLKGSDKE